MKNWILVGQTPIEVDRDEWARWFETCDRRVDNTVMRIRERNYRISTVFLGINMDFGDEIPELFETMVFTEDGDDPWANYAVRSRSWLEAKKVHLMIEIQVGSNDKP